MKQLTGKIVSAAMTNTVVVEVTRNWKHPLYKKVVKRTKNFPAHIEGMEAKVGDVVVIQETKPYSKTKHFKVLNKVN